MNLHSKPQWNIIIPLSYRDAHISHLAPATPQRIPRSLKSDDTSCVQIESRATWKTSFTPCPHSHPPHPWVIWPRLLDCWFQKAVGKHGGADGFRCCSVIRQASHLKHSDSFMFGSCSERTSSYTTAIDRSTLWQGEGWMSGVIHQKQSWLTEPTSFPPWSRWMGCFNDALLVCS